MDLSPRSSTEIQPLLNVDTQPAQPQLHQHVVALFNNELAIEPKPILKAGLQFVVLGAATTNIFLANVVQNWTALPPWVQMGGSIASVVTFFGTEVALGFRTIQDETNTWAIGLSTEKRGSTSASDIGWGIARAFAVLSGPFITIPLLYYGYYYNGRDAMGFAKGAALALSGAFKPARGMYLSVKRLQASRQRRNLNPSDQRVLKAKTHFANAIRNAERPEDRTLQEWLQAQLEKTQPKPAPKKSVLAEVPGYATSLSLLTFVGTLGYYGGKILARGLKQGAQIAVGVTTSAITTVGHGMLSWEYVKKVPQLAVGALRNLFTGNTGLSKTPLALVGGTVLICGAAQMTTIKEVIDAYPSLWARIPQLIFMPAASLFLNSSALAEGIALATQRIGITRNNPKHRFADYKEKLSSAIDRMDLTSFRKFLQTSPYKTQLIQTLNLEPADLNSPTQQEFALDTLV